MGFNEWRIVVEGIGLFAVATLGIKGKIGYLIADALIDVIEDSGDENLKKEAFHKTKSEGVEKALDSLVSIKGYKKEHHERL